MDSENGHDPAKQRWMLIQLMRLGGIAMVLVGLLAVNNAIGLGETVGYLLIALGLVETFVMPTLLARRWATPKDRK
jgi:hypothetical protein